MNDAELGARPIAAPPRGSSRNMRLAISLGAALMVLIGLVLL